VSAPAFIRAFAGASARASTIRQLSRELRLARLTIAEELASLEFSAGDDGHDGDRDLMRLARLRRAQIRRIDHAISTAEGNTT